MRKTERKGLSLGGKYSFSKETDNWIADIKIDLFEYTMMKWAGVSRLL
jgi:hypothetical protein